MKKPMGVVVLVVLLMFVFSSFCLAATVTGRGKQTRGYPGHNAELYGETFNLPRAGTIASVDSYGASGFWIENSRGDLIVNFDSVNQAIGYNLAAGSYRVLPNLKNGYDSCSVAVNFNCP